MKKPHSTRISVWVVFVLFCAQKMPLRAQSDLYSFPKIDEDKVKVETEKERRPADPFTKALAKRTDLPEKELADAFAKGFGRTELIRLILISKKASKPLADLLREREKGARLNALASQNGLNPKNLKMEASEMLRELVQEEKKIKAELERSSATVAGMNETLTKDATAQATPPSKK